MTTFRAALVALLLAFPCVALAQGEPDPAEERSQAFEAATGAQTENVPGGTLMVVAYGAVFLLVLGYTVSLGFRQAKTQREIELLRGDLAAAREQAGQASANEGD